MKASARASCWWPPKRPLHDPQPESKRWIVTELDDWIFSFDYSDRLLREHFRLHSLDGCGLADRPNAVAAGGAVLHYLRDTQRAALDHLDAPRYFDRAETMVLDAVTVRNLELVEPIFSDGGATLVGVLDQTATGMGGRLLRQRLLRPSLDLAEIEARLDVVSDFARETILRAELRKQLAPVLDIERLLAKVTIAQRQSARSPRARQIARPDPASRRIRASGR